MDVLSDIYTTTNKLHDGRINDLEELFIMTRKKILGHRSPRPVL